MLRTRTASAVIVAGIVAVGVTACSSDSGKHDSGNNSSPSTAQNALYAQLPQKIKDSGITIAGIAESPPNVTHDKDGKTLIGITPDLMSALSKVLGVKVAYEPVQDFASILTGVQANRYDGGYLFGDNATREEVADMVDFQSTGVIFVGGSGVPAAGDGFPCGSSVAVPRGSAADLGLTALNKPECTGKSPLDIKQFANGAAGYVALDSGQVKYFGADPLSGAYAVQQSGGKYTAGTKIWAAIPAGFAMSKDDPQLNAVLVKALQQLVDDGTMKQIFEKWHADPKVISSVVSINAAKNSS